jgi:hypothetical protein
MVSKRKIRVSLLLPISLLLFVFGWILFKNKRKWTENNKKSTKTKQAPELEFSVMPIDEKVIEY